MFENDTVKKTGRKAQAGMSQTKSVKNISPLDTRDLGIIIDGGAT